MAEKKNIVLTSVLLEILLILAPLGFDMPVIAKWIMWSFCALLLVPIFFHYKSGKQASIKVKTICLILIYILFWLIFNNSALDARMKEKAEQTSGILLIDRSTCKKPITKD